MKTANTKFIPLLLPPLRFFLPFLIISFHSPDFYAQVSTPYIKYTYDSLPVLYYLHGSGENYINESSWAQLWNKSMEDSFPEMVIVLVNPVIENYYYQKTEATVVNELRTHIIQTYRVSDMGECTAICGFSLGGQGAMQLPLNHSGFFSQTVVLAGAPFQDIEAHISNYKANGTGNLNIRITVGTEDQNLSSSQWLKEELESAEIPFMYKEYKGIGHSSDQTFGDSVYRTETFLWQTENLMKTCPVTLRNAALPVLGEYDLPFVDEYNPISSKPVPPNVFSLQEISPSEIKLTWASNPKPVIGYIVQKIVPYAPGYIFLDTLSAETLCFTDSLEITCDSIYAYQVYAYNDVGTSSPYLAKIRTRKCITSIPGEKDIWPVKIYPNPAYDRIFVILEGISDLTNIVLVITDISGRFIFNQNITKYQSEIDMSDFSKGNYMISVLKKNVSICTTKIMLK